MAFSGVSEMLQRVSELFKGFSRDFKSVPGAIPLISPKTLRSLLFWWMHECHKWRISCMWCQPSDTWWEQLPCIQFLEAVKRKKSSTHHFCMCNKLIRCSIKNHSWYMYRTPDAQERVPKNLPSLDNVNRLNSIEWRTIETGIMKPSTAEEASFIHCVPRLGSEDRPTPEWIRQEHPTAVTYYLPTYIAEHLFFSNGQNSNRFLTSESSAWHFLLRLCYFQTLENGGRLVPINFARKMSDGAVCGSAGWRQSEI